MDRRRDTTPRVTAAIMSPTGTGTAATAGIASANRSLLRSWRAAAVLSIAMLLCMAALAASADAKTNAVFGWGANADGDLGNGTRTPSEVPVRAGAPEGPGVEDAVQLSAGEYSTYARLSNGTLADWGDNSYGQLGNGLGEPGVFALLPEPVPGLAGVTSVAAGGTFALALLSNGTVVAWGNGGAGQLGDGSVVSSNVPVTVSGLTNVKAIAAGAATGLALLKNGTVMSWGDGEHGQLGNGEKAVFSDVPVQVEGLKSVKAIGMGRFFGLAVVKAGAVDTWGEGGSGELGDGTQEVDADVPVSVVDLTGAVKAVAGGADGGMALLKSGSVEDWGQGTQGQLGDGSDAGSDVAVPVKGLAGVKAIAEGASHSMALMSNKTVMTWGEGEFGQLGDESTLNSDEPVAAKGLSAIKFIGSGSNANFSLAGN
jgi:alpha-tubulin suppressor-like RCC1 family protein